MPLSIDLGPTSIRLRAVVRRKEAAAVGETELGLEFATRQRKQLAQLAIALLASDFSTEESFEEAPARSKRRAAAPATEAPSLRIAGG